MRRSYNDDLTMTKRCLLRSVRNPDTILTSILLPALLMLLFVSLFGKMIRVDGISYVNYIVPGVLLQCVGQCSSTTSIGVSRDITGGLVHRFRTLPIRKSSILAGHIWEAVLRNTVTSVIVLLAAVLLGFRPRASAFDWLIVSVLLVGVILAVYWASVLIGITANSAEGASSLSAIVVILPYLSSGFVPADQMPELLAVFARYQPMTPIIDTMRNGFLGNPFDSRTFWIAALWCAALTALFYFLSMRAFRKRMSR